MKILHLTLKKLPFDVMVTGEKSTEYRKPSKWIESRLFDRNGKLKHYDAVKCTNGYGSLKPNFVAEFIGVSRQLDIVKHMGYSNGLSVTVNIGDYRIHLGKIIETKNLK